MFRKTFFELTAVSIMLAHTAGCSISASGTLYRSAEPTGEEYELTGVVNGLWEFDVDRNKSRLEKLLPEGTSIDIDEASKLYQVRVGVKKSLFNASASEVVILPDGWSHATTSDREGEKVLNIGDVVAIRAQKNRFVDYFTNIVRKCDEPPKADERPEWNIGCQSISEFGGNGYGGNRYFWAGF